ncbi:spondin domain-containing protein [Pseudoalteromonas sp. SCSIO 43201]|uniref:spondin domain-containing protein n=2 Tax=unclassified Pseudoalteromonas TaxID=194690 RepID=UPI0020752548|nr:spondin domain-containing protein [Pseudoalteromonas sp. SCSIO 43201]USD29443.1 spondin domain-containing protein [Pseudoalteromonas sp. SCSIO 43201]
MKTKLTLVAISALLLSACGDNDNNSTVVTDTPTSPVVDYEFSVSITNLTQAQPMSPIAVMLHQSGHYFEVGTAASNELEKLAEGGDNSALLAQSMTMSSSTTETPVGPGSTSTISIKSETLANLKLSLLTMMVNTNDGFSGLNAIDVSTMPIGEKKMYRTSAYDAGTELNTEAQGSIPGPADGGEGFNVERNDNQNMVTMHSGVVGNDDGLTSSTLTSIHKFDNPLLAITIERIK